MYRNERGSVLMEFVIVLPIYMLLLGFAFVSGELALQAIRLSASADRTCAMAHDKFDLFKRAVSPHDARDGANGGDWDQDATWQEDDAFMHSYEGDPNGGTLAVSEYATNKIEGVADADFEGPWTKVVAAKVKDDYTLTPLTRGFVAFWYGENDRRIEDMGGNATEGVLDDILKDGIGRVEMVGKDLTGRDYGYYCLQRNEYGRKGYRTWDAGNLALNSAWQNYVLSDIIAPSDYEDIEDAKRVKEETPSRPQPEGEPVKQYPDEWTR